jgi:pyruvate dehydrogenase E1 component alpha subunit
MSEIGAAEGLQLLREMVRIRRFEEKSAELYGAAKIRGFLHLYVGEEAIAVGAIRGIQPEAHQDALVSTYREHGHALVRGVPMNTIMAEMYGKETGCSRGRGGSMHLFDASRRFFGGNAIVGGGIPIAVGLALADRVLGRSSIVACFFGDGAAAEGVFAESLNLAALWKLPVLFLCENNRYAMGTALNHAHAQTKLSAKAQAYGVESEQVDGMDVLAVLEATQKAAAAVRGQQKPRFIEFLTYRFRAHSMYDPELYRPKTEVDEWKKRDPIGLLRGRLAEGNQLTAGEYERLEREADQEIAEAVAFAERSPWEPVEKLMDNVYTPGMSRTERSIGEPAA